MNLRRDVFQALADPTRRSILLLLASQSMTAGAIASNFDSARPTVSKHIQILSECDLLKKDRKGREIYYELNVTKMKIVDDWMNQFRTIWQNRFNNLDQVLLTIKKNEK
ncbi:metalloregulator ArsR/SmtB family transcription factor [Psychroserpens luteolus]|uniref:metalloregulator ArsR/SmtB family transcription factor n=1 Tax=Psychroserpens luteolus TaxID=2855840 RepID=UPI001E3FC836|nr:metalloregulator ArsR/SmtB family transcription factor [Psychroserpens luteolus]MCD2257783.1 metalloregulator ArsR/SmtB family transcription factor [Psychroserpens luteolus]